MRRWLATDVGQPDVGVVAVLGVAVGVAVGAAAVVQAAVGAGGRVGPEGSLSLQVSLLRGSPFTVTANELC